MVKEFLFKKLKEFFKKLWDERKLVAITLIFAGVLDLIGITSWDLGLGFILGLIALGIISFF